MVEKLNVSETEARRWLTKNKTIKSLERLPGDASTRRYYRVKAPRQSFILMKLDPFASTAEKQEFLQVREFLAMRGVDVPEVFDVDPKRGFILLEDLGDQTLLRRLQNVADFKVERDLYNRVVEKLVHMQEVAMDKPDPKLNAFKNRFDTEKLLWELNFTVTQFYERHLNRKISPASQRILDRQFGKICRYLDKQKPVFCHRDFHSRNLMIADRKKETRVVMIDFQDARLGPATYDLASILRDSYYQLEERQVRGLIDTFYDLSKKRVCKSYSRDHLHELFDFTSIQRNLKAIGSFASFLNMRGNPTYLKYIGNTFENIRRTLLRHPEYSDLREVLFHYYYF